AVLTNVGLEHTRWLGPTVRDIASEKLAVVRPGSTLVLGAGLDPEARAVAATAPAGRVVEAPAEPVPPKLVLAALGSFQRRNFALAEAAAEALLGSLDDQAVAEAAASVLVPGRFQVIDHEPLTILDGAHNPGGMEALAAAIAGGETARRPLVAV